ncbi:MAG TPA: cupredoxin domain-containing protein [Rhodocyclaceae bacterium]|nr:cupredoxin domain-containing protein [Rhodocyclaceae bacterium]
MDRTRRKWLALMTGGSLGLGALSRFVKAQQTETVIPILAKKFTFVPNVITLQKDVPVVLALTSDEVLMGFVAADFKIRTDIVPGKSTELRFTPDRVGKFDFYCDVDCGIGHDDMEGSFIVVA